MKLAKIITIVMVLLGSINLTAQSDLELITSTLMDYIEGTANGEPERIARAFHPDLNLYTIQDDSLRTRSGKRYISNFEKGKKSNRIGRIISIDFENDAASAKIEVVITGRKAPEKLIEYADLVTEMKEIKHYYTQGIEARTGIEK